MLSHDKIPADAYVCRLGVTSQKLYEWTEQALIYLNF